MTFVDDVYDYIVLGSGSAGCVLAARLSENPRTRVLLVERGGVMSAVTGIPAAWPTLFDSAESWPGDTVAQEATGTAVRWPRGRGLGGSSGINGMVFIRGHVSSYDQWAELGAKGWAYDDLLPFFRKAESASRSESALRGDSGPMIVAPSSPGHPIARAGLAAAEELGYPVAADISSGVEAGFGMPDTNIVNGERQSAMDAYLAPALNRENLDVVTDALVHRVIVHEGRAVGVEFSVGTELFEVACAEEIVLTAGTIGSAEILLRSGIGPMQQLEDLGIETVVDLPGVGENLHDHPMSGVTYRSSESLPPSVNNHAEAFGLLAGDGGESPDLHFIMASVPYHLAAQQGPGSPDRGYTIAVGLMKPRSRGVLRLAGKDPETPSLVDPRYLTDPRDREVLKAGLRIARRLGAAEAFRAWRAEEVLPGPFVDDDLDEYLRESLMSYFHYVGTCRMGTDEMAVVDTDLRVRGVVGLRVADASVMPSVPSANTYATVLAIAERAAALIAADGAVSNS
ncbi:GMC family oxidoreductase [Lentzea sp. CA-135723]|uniref:GMC family oxidoreductase n=1 Tax=Lentzea sp. CA-135723 TaxID=3239950 RepID=UPI003D920AB3